MTREEGNNTTVYFYIKLTFTNDLYTVFKVHGDYTNLLSAKIELYNKSKQRFESVKLKNITIIIKDSEFEPDMIDDNYCSPNRFKITFTKKSGKIIFLIPAMPVPLENREMYIINSKAEILGCYIKKHGVRDRYLCNREDDDILDDTLTIGKDLNLTWEELDKFIENLKKMKEMR